MNNNTLKALKEHRLINLTKVFERIDMRSNTVFVKLDRGSLNSIEIKEIENATIDTIADIVKIGDIDVNKVISKLAQ